jgi:uncharacterized protein
VNGREIEFDSDDANTGHVARHNVQPDEAEQVILNDPVDLGMESVEREELFLNLGATSRGRVLLVVTTWREDRVRVVRESEPITFIGSAAIIDPTSRAARPEPSRGGNPRSGTYAKLPSARRKRYSYGQDASPRSNAPCVLRGMRSRSFGGSWLDDRSAPKAPSSPT